MGTVYVTFDLISKPVRLTELGRPNWTLRHESPTGLELNPDNALPLITPDFKATEDPDQADAASGTRIDLPTTRDKCRRVTDTPE